MKDDFPIGFWPTGGIDTVELSDVAEWAECGMTLTLMPWYSPDPTRKERMLALLDECQRFGIRLILSDSRATFRGAAKDPESYRAGFAEAVADFGHHPTVFGFHLGDEPVHENFEDIKTAVAIQMEVAPHLTPYLNHYPMYHDVLKLLKCNSYEEWANKILPELKLPIISFDHYTQMNPYGQGEGVDSYYTSLRTYCEAAKKTGVPMWSVVLSVGHFRYRCPNEDDIRWQLYTSVMHGAKGVLWFYYRMTRSHINYRNAPINELGEKTETWTWLSRQLRLFHKTYGPLMMRLHHQDTWHLGRAYGGWKNWSDETHSWVVKNFISHYRHYGVISRFTDDDGNEYVAILNNDQKESGLFSIVLDPSVKRLWRVCFGGEEHDVATDHWDARYSVTDHIESGTWLAPGQMEIYRLEIEA